MESKAPFLLTFGDGVQVNEVNFPPLNNGTPNEVPLDLINGVGDFSGEFYVLHDMGGDTARVAFSKTV